MYVVKRSSTSGSAVDTAIPQTSWNLDPMNGEGVSGLNINADKAQIFVIDLEWLGVGRVRLGFGLEGNIYYVHEFIHANISTTTYMTTANLPVRYKIENTGTTSGVGTLKMICTTVISEGGFESDGIPFAVSRADDNHVTVGVTIYPVISIRLKSASKRVLCKLLETITFSVGKADVMDALYYYIAPSSSPLTGESWVSADADSAVEYDMSATAVDLTDAKPVRFGYFANNTNVDISKIDKIVYLTSNILGTSDIIVLAAQKLGTGTEKIHASLQWTEYQT